MGGSKGGPSSQVQASESATAAGQLALAQGQDKRAQQLYDLSLPGFQTALQHYTDLSSGDSQALFHAVAPGTQAIARQGDQAKQNISDTMQRGGARDLAMEETDISKAGAIGSTINTEYESSFAGLANLAGKGIGLSINEVSNAIAAFGGASNTYGNIANQQEAGKAATMGMFASLGGSAMEMAGGL